MVLLGVILGGLTILIGGGLMATSPTTYFRLLNWWYRHLPGAKVDYDIYSPEFLRSPARQVTFRASGLGLMLGGMFFVIVASRKLVARAIQSNGWSPSSPRLIALPFLIVGIALLCKPIATITLLQPHTFSSAYLSDPRAALGFRILGAGFVLFSLFALWPWLRGLL